MNFNIIQAAEVKLWDFSAYFWNTPRTLVSMESWSSKLFYPQVLKNDAIFMQKERNKQIVQRQYLHFFLLPSYEPRQEKTYV